MYKTRSCNKWEFQILGWVIFFNTATSGIHNISGSLITKVSGILDSRMTRRWWSAISPQLGRSALDILPPYLLTWDPLTISSSCMLHSFALQYLSRFSLLPPSTSMTPFPLAVGWPSLFLTPRLDSLSSFYLALSYPSVPLFVLRTFLLVVHHVVHFYTLRAYDWGMFMEVSVNYNLIFFYWLEKQ